MLLLKKPYFNPINSFVYKNSYIFACFFIPFLLWWPQTLVGTLVNACLLITSLKLSPQYFLPIAILPSLGVLSRGMIFGGLTINLIYLLPAIWFANLFLLSFFRTLFFKKNFNLYLSLFFGGVIKVWFLFSFTWLLTFLDILPTIFLTLMWSQQLLTIFLGSIFFSVYCFYFPPKKI